MIVIIATQLRMSASADGKNENKGLLARTATYTSKKARRAQTKVSLICVLSTITYKTQKSVF